MTKYKYTDIKAAWELQFPGGLIKRYGSRAEAEAVKGEFLLWAQENGERDYEIPIVKLVVKSVDISAPKAK